LEGMTGEGGPGQLEINFKYSELLENCDNHIYFKQCIKHTLFKEGLGCTFMAKPFEEYSGSSFHVHISLYDQKGNNIFGPSLKVEENYEMEIGHEEKLKCSLQLIHFIGGIMKYIDEFFLIFAPYVNSYKRFKKYSCAPFYINTWSYESRFAAVRVVGNGENTHIEVRISAADANPYLVFTALLSMGMEGIKNKILPPEISIGDVYVDKGRTAAPKNLDRAIELFEKSEIAKVVFGKDYAEYLISYAKNEWELYENHISNFEINRYLDLV
jgi:glutamine synthetase